MSETAQVTMKHVADALSISPSTVSIVLNGRAEECRISRETQEKVLDKASEMGYGLPRRPIHRRSLILANPSQLPVDSTTRSPLAKVLPILKNQLMERGWVVRLGMDESKGILGVSDQMLAEAGVVVIPALTGKDDEARKLARRAVKKGVIPVIAGALFTDIDCLSLDKDNYGGGQLVAEYLYELGHRSIAIFCGNEDNPHVEARLNGFSDVLAEKGCPLQEQMIWRAGSWKLTTAHRKILEFIKERPRPTAIFFMGDGMALGGYYALREAGLSVPEDISIVGFDDSWGLEGEVPEMTTVRLDAESVSDSIVRTLISMAEGEGPLRAQILFPGEIIVRSTTKAVTQ